MTDEDKEILQFLPLVSHVVKRIKRYRPIEYDDLISEGSIALITAVRGYRPELGKKKTYYYLSVKWRLQDYVRKTIHEESNLDFTEDETVWSKPVEYDYDSYIIQSKIRSIVDELPEPFRSVITLIYFNGYSMKEVGEMYNCTRQNVSLIVIRARKLLWHKIRKEGIPCHLKK